MSRPDNRTTDASAWDPSGNQDPRRNRCACGNQIDPDLGRVFGDNDDRVQQCLGCATNRELRQGGAAGHSVQPAKSNTAHRGGGEML